MNPNIMPIPHKGYFSNRGMSVDAAVELNTNLSMMSNGIKSSKLKDPI